MYWKQLEKGTLLRVPQSLHFCLPKTSVAGFALFSEVTEGQKECARTPWTVKYLPVYFQFPWRLLSASSLIWNGLGQTKTDYMEQQ